MKYSKEKIAKKTFTLALAAIISAQTMPINVLADVCKPEDMSKPGCEEIVNNSLVNPVETKSNVMKDKLEPKDINVWKSDKINWKDGVRLKDDHKDNQDLKKTLEESEITDESNRSSDSASKQRGNLNVKFKDNSNLKLEQNLNVSEHLTDVNNPNAPSDAVTVRFYLTKGTKVERGGVLTEGADKPVETSAFKAKPGLDLKAYKHPAIHDSIFNLINAVGSEGKKGVVKWFNENNSEDMVVSENNRNFYAKFIEEVDAPKPNENPKDKEEKKPDSNENEDKKPVPQPQQPTPQPQQPAPQKPNENAPKYRREYKPDYLNHSYAKRDEKTETKSAQKTIAKKEEKAVAKTKEYYFYLDKADYEAIVDGKSEKRTMDVLPFAVNGRTMLPVRFIAETLGAAVEWDQSTKTATFTKNGVSAKVMLGSKSVTISDGRTVELDAEPMVVKNRIMLPVTNIAQIFCLTNGDITDENANDIEWDKENMRVIIRTK